MRSAYFGFSTSTSLCVTQPSPPGRIAGRSAPIREPVSVPPFADFGSVGTEYVGEKLGVEFEDVFMRVHFEDVVGKFFEARDGLLRIGKVREAGAPGVWHVGVVVDGGVGHVDGKKVEANFLGEMVAVAVAEVVGGTGGIGLARVFFLIRIATEVVFLFQKQPVFAAKEVGGGESGGA